MKTFRNILAALVMITAMSLSLSGQAQADFNPEPSLNHVVVMDENTFKPQHAQACGNGTLSTSCEAVTDQKYGGGGSNPNTVPIQACIPPNIFESLRLQDGTAAFEAGFRYPNGGMEEVTTVRNTNCWTEYRPGVRQYGVPGSSAIAFVCCDLYCGWLAGVIQSNGDASMQPVILPRQGDPMAQYRTLSTDHNGQYSRSRILR